MKVGERYVIEIDEIFRKYTTNIYDETKLARIKGFNSLVFDENGLSKLEKLEDVIQEECDIARQEGFEEGKMVGYNEALLKCQDNKSEKIQKYDICKMHGIEYCVTQIYSSCGDTFLDLIDKTGALYSKVDAILFTKVGHIDSLDKWLKEIQ